MVSALFGIRWLSLFCLLAGAALPASPYEVAASSLIGDGGTDASVGAAILTDGRLVMAVNTGLQDFGGVSASAVPGASVTDRGTLVYLSTDGGTVTAMRKVGGEVFDFSTDGNDNLYVALGAEGAVKVDPDADAVLWRVDDFEVHRLDAGALGFCALLGDPGAYDFGGLHRLRLLDPSGAELLDRSIGLRAEDVGVSEERETLVISGFNIGFVSGSEFHLAFYQALAFNGSERYTGYNWTPEEWVAQNPWEQTRSRTLSIGQDGNLHIVHVWTGKGYNCLARDPFDRAVQAPMLALDKYQNIESLRWGEEGDSKKKLLLASYAIGDGSLLRIIPFTNYASQGPGTTRVESPGAIDVDPDGRFHFVGSGASKLPVPPEYFADPADPETGAENAINDGYAGGMFLGVMNADFSKRLYCGLIGRGRFDAVATRRLNGETVAFTVGRYSNNGFFRLNAIQPDLAGGQDGAFTVFNQPGTAGAPEAPANLVASAPASGRIDLAWDDLSGAEDGFLIERKPAGGTFSRLATVPRERERFADLTVESGQAYTYRVRAFNLAGDSAPANEAVATALLFDPPAAPAVVVAEALNASQVRLSWSPVDGAGGYFVDRRRSGEADWTAAGEFPGAQYANTFSGLAAGSGHEFRVRAFHSGGLSGPSAVASALTADLPLMPASAVSETVPGLCYEYFQVTGVLGQWQDYQTTLTKLGDGVADNLDATAHSGGLTEDYFVSYGGYLDIPADGTYRFVSRASKACMVFIDDELVVNNGSWSWGPWEAEGQAGLEAGLHKLVVQFMFTYGRNDDPFLELWIEGPGLPLQQVPSALLRRDAACAFGGSPPPTPENLQVEVLAGNRTRLSWEHPGGAAGAFAVEKNPYLWNTYDPFKEVVLLPPDRRTYVNNHLEPGVEASYRVRALNAYGYSPYTSVVSVTPAVPADSAPAAPDSLVSSAVSTDSLSLSWHDNAFDESGFVVRYRRQDESGWRLVEVPRNRTIVSLPGLEDGTPYLFEVLASNSYGDSAPAPTLLVSTTASSIQLPVPSIHIDGGEAVISFVADEGLLYTVRGSSTLAAPLAVWTEYHPAVSLAAGPAELRVPFSGSLLFLVLEVVEDE